MMDMRCGGCRSVDGAAGGLEMCLLPFGVGFLTGVDQSVSIAEVWLKRGANTIDSNQECPPSSSADVMGRVTSNS
jgi:hypothetical protein